MTNDTIDNIFFPDNESQRDLFNKLFGTGDMIPLEKKHPWNVISEQEFKTRMREIFSQLNEVLSNTVGPFGSGTLIEKLGHYYMTKDGFTVLKNIHFDNRTDNTIMDLILTMSHQMVMKVGDGSTTAIMAAYSFLNRLSEYENSTKKKIRPKDFISLLSDYIDILSKEIQSSSIPVTEKNYIDVVERIASVATNDNETYSKFIKEIYEKSGMDVSITKKLSSTSNASYSTRDDKFFINGKYLDRIYLNTQDDTCVLENPYIIMFDFTLEDKHWSLIQMLVQSIERLDDNQGRRILIIAPYYDQYFGDRIKTDVIKFRQWYSEQVKQGGAVPYHMVFAAAPFIRSVDHYIYDDATAFLGNAVINPVTADEFINKVKAYTKALIDEQEAIKAYKNALKMAEENGEDISAIKPPEYNDKSAKLFKESHEMFTGFIGTCERVILGSKSIEFAGFNNKDDSMIELRINDSKAMLNKELEQIENLRYVGKDYIYAKERMSRIACKSATIEIGGNSDLEKSMNSDAVDDAIKACESAIQYGYVPGNNIAIFTAIERVLNDNIEEGKYNTIGEILKSSFIDVITKIYQNKDSSIDSEAVRLYINKGMKYGQCYDLIKEDFSDKIINSCRTDIEILKGAISIIGIILSANQYIAGEIQENK